MKGRSSKTARRLVWTGFAMLFLLHQDFWWWDDRTLVWGYLPIGMFYHILFSIAAAVLWICAIRWAWPEHLEEWATGSDRPEPDRAESDAPSTEAAPR
jgi:hypothetical protein